MQDRQQRTLIYNERGPPHPDPSSRRATRTSRTFPRLAPRTFPRRATRTLPCNQNHSSPRNQNIRKKNSALCAFTGIQRIERFQHYLPLVNNGALRGKRCNVRSACGRLDAPSSFTRRRALISANSLLRTIFSTCRRYSWRGDDDSHHLPLHAEVR